MSYALDSFVGRRIAVFLPILDPKNPECTSVVLRGVESGGLWIECDRRPLSLEKTGKTTIFVPWQQIVYVDAHQSGEVMH